MKMLEKTQILNSYYNGYYDALYQNPDAIDESEAAETAIHAIDTSPMIQKHFIALQKLRNDIIASDREYAAFLLAYPDAEKAWKEVEKNERKRASIRRKFRKQYGNFVGDVLYLQSLNYA